MEGRALLSPLEMCSAFFLDIKGAFSTGYPKTSSKSTDFYFGAPKSYTVGNTVSGSCVVYT